MFRDVVDLVWPRICPGCGRADINADPACAVCLAALRRAAVRVTPSPAPPGLPPVWASAAYDGVVRALLLAHKERGRRALAGSLGAALSAALVAAHDAVSGGSGPCVVVPVPSSGASRRARGDDPTLRVVRYGVAALRRAGVEATLLPALRHGRRVRDQAGLSAMQRAANLGGALRVVASAREPLERARAVLLADDVVTTGATLAEAARALNSWGARVDAAGVVAATSRRGAMVATIRRSVPDRPPADSVQPWRPPGSVVAPDRRSG